MDEQTIDFLASPWRHVRRSDLVDPLIARKDGQSRDPQVSIERIESEPAAVAHHRDMRATRDAIPRLWSYEAPWDRVVSDQPRGAEIHIGLVSPKERAVAPAWGRILLHRVEGRVRNVELIHDFRLWTRLDGEARRVAGRLQTVRSTHGKKLSERIRPCERARHHDQHRHHPPRHLSRHFSSSWVAFAASPVTAAGFERHALRC